MINIKKLANQNQTFILIAAGFEERFVVDCLCSLRERGLPVWLVGLTANRVNGMSGLTVQPDFSLTQLEMLLPFQTGHQFVLPGDQTCAAMLLSDPRVHRLVNETFEAGGYVMTTPPAEQALWQTHLFASQPPAHFLTQNRMETAEYVRQLIHLVTTVP